MRIVTALPPPSYTAAGADPARVAAILADVRQRGDEALRDWTERLDRHVPARWQVPVPLMEQAWSSVAEPVRVALQTAADNIRRFAVAQRESHKAFEIEVAPGFFAGQRLEPVASVACYVPGGRYPLPSTVLMTAIPARAAGVARVVVLSPPGPNGWPDKHILAAARLAQVDAVYAVGGAQAVAAAAYGTASIAAVDLLVGPGNAWVTEAKRQVYGQLGIDALAGPSEVMVLFDGSSDIARVAADLLAQAEHDAEAIAIAVTTEQTAAWSLAAEVERQLALLPTKAIAAEAIARHGAILVVADRAALLQVANDRAPEHLEVCTRDAAQLAAECTAFGGLFVGGEAAEVLGDYVSGPSHVLPTSRAGRYTGGLGVQTFTRVLTTQRAEAGKAAHLATVAAVLARVEGLEGHARAADLRAL